MALKVIQMRLVVMILFVSISYFTNAQTGFVKGVVFVDANGNGVYDPGEQTLENVLVSNQKDIVETDKNGRYKLPYLKNKLVYVIKPQDFHFPIDEYGLPQFYIEQDTGSDYDFALINKMDKKITKAIIIGDPQMADDDRLDYYRDGVVKDMMRHEADFYLTLGDIADDNLEVYQREKMIMSALNMPGYHVPGNHDLSYKSTDIKERHKEFSRTYGPDYYSFNYGQTHFIILNNISYEGWNTTANTKGSYFGGLDVEQVEWLKTDLSYVPDSHLIVVNTHIPFREEYHDVDGIKKLNTLLNGRQNLLALSGHLHAVQTYFNDSTTYWTGKAKYESVVCGATCGSWWTGPNDEEGIPLATCTDGSPKGYFLIEFEGADYNYKFIPLNQKDEFQIRLTLTEDSLAQKVLVANWFIGKPHEQVSLRIDNGEFFKMINYTGKDPFMQSSIHQRINKDGWTPGVAECKHLWKTFLPESLECGVHRIEVKAISEDQKEFTAFKIIEQK